MADPLDDGRILDEGKDPHRMTALRTQERQALVDPHQQQRPAARGDSTEFAARFFLDRRRGLIFAAACRSFALGARTPQYLCL